MTSVLTHLHTHVHSLNAVCEWEELRPTVYPNATLHLSLIANFQEVYRKEATWLSKDLPGFP